MSIKKIFWQYLPWIIIFIGLTLRLDQYIFNRSLWLDEAFVAVNITNRTFIELLKAPLEYSSYIVPPGFLMMAKLSTICFGNSDFVLRLFPFLCGSLALLFYYPMAKRYVSERSACIALFFFAISDSLIFYSSEFKQYSSDLLIDIILLWYINNFSNIFKTYDYDVSKNHHNGVSKSPDYGVSKSHILTFTKLSHLAIIGMISIWFSHSSVFILATIGIYLIFPFLLKKEWISILKLISVYLIWLLNFGILYWFFIHVDTPSNGWMHKFWTEQNAFMQLPFSKESVLWFYNTFLTILKYPGSFENINIAGYLFIIGIIVQFANKNGTLFLLLCPAFIALVASSFEQYTFSGRLLLFLLPSLYLIIAESIVQLEIKFSAYPKSAILGVITQIVLIVSLINYPIYHRVVIEEVKPVFEYIQKHKQANDRIYLYYWAEPVFRYYATQYNFSYENCHIITPIPINEYIKEVDYFRNKQNLKPVPLEQTQCVLGISESFHQSKSDLDQLRGSGRVWFVFSHITENEKRLFLNYLDAIGGSPIDENLQSYAFTYLYNL